MAETPPKTRTFLLLLTAEAVGVLDKSAVREAWVHQPGTTVVPAVTVLVLRLGLQQQLPATQVFTPAVAEGVHAAMAQGERVETAEAQPGATTEPTGLTLQTEQAEAVEGPEDSLAPTEEPVATEL